MDAIDQRRWRRGTMPRGEEINISTNTSGVRGGEDSPATGTLSGNVGFQSSILPCDRSLDCKLSQARAAKRLGWGQRSTGERRSACSTGRRRRCPCKPLLRLPTCLCVSSPLNPPSTTPSTRGNWMGMILYSASSLRGRPRFPTSGREALHEVKKKKLSGPGPPPPLTDGAGGRRCPPSPPRGRLSPPAPLSPPPPSTAHTAGR